MRVLVADDDAEIAAVVAEFVRKCDHEVVATVTTGGEDVVALCAMHRPDLLFLDIIMPNIDGIAICDQVTDADPAPKVVLLSGKFSGHHPDVMRSRATAFLQKPLRLVDMRRMLHELSHP